MNAAFAGYARHSAVLEACYSAICEGTRAKRDEGLCQMSDINAADSLFNNLSPNCTPRAAAALYV